MTEIFFSRFFATFYTLCDRKVGQKLSRNIFSIEFRPSQFGHEDFRPKISVRKSVLNFCDRFFRSENFSERMSIGQKLRSQNEFRPTVFWLTIFDHNISHNPQIRSQFSTKLVEKSVTKYDFCRPVCIYLPRVKYLG